MWELHCEESWAPKNWLFGTVVLEKTPRVPWTTRRSYQSTLKEISPGCPQEGLMLKLKLQYFGHLMRRVDSLEKTLMLGGTGGRWRRGRQTMRWLNGITDSMDMSWVNSGSWWWTGRPGALWFMGLQRAGHYWITEVNWLWYKNVHWNNINFRAVIRFGEGEGYIINFNCISTLKNNLKQKWLKLWSFGWRVRPRLSLGCVMCIFNALLLWCDLFAPSHFPLVS